MYIYYMHFKKYFFVTRLLRSSILHIDNKSQNKLVVVYYCFIGSLYFEKV